jgi:hypothetical protein
MSVIIIGNGFDRNLGFPTGYPDFLKSEQFQNLLDQKNGIAVHLESVNSLQNWIDIENEFQKYSDSFNNTYGPSHQKESVKRWYLEIVNALIEYLNTIDYTKYDKNSEAFKLLQSIDKVTYICDFNYTPSVSLIAKELELDNRVAHIKVHGGLEDKNIVFGVSDGCDIYKEHNFLRKAATKNYPAIDLADGLREPDEIHIFGHSLGNMDYDYFKPFFTYIANLDPTMYEHRLERKYRARELTIYYKDNDRDFIIDRLYDLTDYKFAEFSKHIQFKEIACQ